MKYDISVLLIVVTLNVFLSIHIIYLFIHRVIHLWFLFVSDIILLYNPDWSGMCSVGQAGGYFVALFLHLLSAGI